MDAMASEATTAEAQQDLPRRVADLERELGEAQQREAATAELLQVINRPQFALQSVFEAMAQSAMRLCEGEFAFVLRFDGELLRFAASYGLTQEGSAALQDSLPRPAGYDTANGRAVLRRAVVQIPDVQADLAYGALGVAEKATYRSLIAVPLLRDGDPIGGITVGRARVGPFSEGQIRLLRTFADQAVIAIEHTRLFEAEQTRTRELTERTKELTEALEYQTATSDVLGVIAASPTDIQPVLQTLVESACRLCAAYDGIILLREGDWLQVKAHHGPIPVNVAKRKVTRDWVNGRCVADRVQIHVQDLQAEVAEYPEGAALAQRLGARTILATPLMREGEAIGAIMIRRDEVRPFSDKQIGLLQTFADQAAIAIENTRLFDEVQARTKELQDSLDRQTATGEVLGVISRSPNEVQPVLDTIVATAQRLCQAERATVWRLEGDTFRAVAHSGQPEERVESLLSARMPLSRGSMVGRATLARRAVQVEDVATDPELVAAHALNRAANTHTVLAVPLLLKGHSIGGITLGRTQVARFDDKQVALVEAFADQAVIAIENSRLFEAEQASKRELTESLEQQTATADVLKVISRSALDLQRVLDALVESAARLCNANDAVIFQVFGDGLRLVAHCGQIPLGGAVGQYTVPLVRGRIYARAVIDRRTIHVADILAEADEYPGSRKVALQTGQRTALAVPLIHAGEAIGVISIRRTEVRPFTERQIELVNAFADQAVIAIENTRLFEEVQARTRELARTVEDLEIASQHKNQFVANMSHELRTPLAAILGYAELIQEGFYEPQGPKSLDALTRIRSNGKHLLGLINTVLDIAKIESGQFTLNMTEYAIESVVDTVRSATESLAQNKKLVLKTEVAKFLPAGLGDEQRLTQVLLNLVGNAIKFTDAGEVRVTAKAVNGHFNVSVTDTGPGIPEEHQTRIFEQFHQVDSSNTKAKGGTGLGLAIAKEIVEMHGGRIWVESTVGKGSTFQMEIPARAQVARPA
jgi:signal transduction histidine kinase